MPCKTSGRCRSPWKGDMYVENWSSDDVEKECPSSNRERWQDFDLTGWWMSVPG